jgi:hypothetical protein
MFHRTTGSKLQALAQQRAQLIVQVQSGLLTAQDAARQLQISRKTYYKWEHRALAAMAKALENRKSGRPLLPIYQRLHSFLVKTKCRKQRSASFFCSCCGSC